MEVPRGSGSCAGGAHLQFLLADAGMGASGSSACPFISSIDFSKAQVLNRACFGKPIYAAMSLLCPARLPVVSRSERRAWKRPVVSIAIGGGFLSGFLMVGAYSFASRPLSGCSCYEVFSARVHVVIYPRSLSLIYPGLEAVPTEEAWRCMQTSRPEFGYLYIAYAHFRAKHWVVRSGIQYGADFMAYRHHPALVHSDYAVVVMVEGEEERLKTWTEVQAMNRRCGSVAKVGA